MIGAFDHTDLIFDSKSECVLYMGLEFFLLSGHHS